MSPAPCLRMRAKASGTAPSRLSAIAPLPSNREPENQKRLEIEATEAETVRLIFKLFLQGDGRSGPMGVKISLMAERHGHTFGNGGLFYTSAVHAILTRPTYSGTHYFNRHDSRAKRARPKEEWVAQEVPAIIPAKTSDASRMLSTNAANVTPARVSNSDVLLTGIVRCRMLRRASHGPHGKSDATATMPVPRTG